MHKSKLAMKKGKRTYYDDSDSKPEENKRAKVEIRKICSSPQGQNAPALQGQTDATSLGQGQSSSSTQDLTGTSSQGHNGLSAVELIASSPKGQTKSSIQGTTTGQQEDAGESKRKDKLIKDLEEKVTILTTKLAKSETKLREREEETMCAVKAMKKTIADKAKVEGYKL